MASTLLGTCTNEREIWTIQNCPQAVWKMAPTSSPSTYAQPEGALKLSGLRLADCPALGISASLIPCSQGVGCEEPLLWAANQFHVGGYVGPSQHQLPRARACMPGFLGSRKGEQSGAVRAWTRGGQVFLLIGYSSSC